ncbi:unnamed protein product [Closterium sp. Naga37s-1]|nr:unnamed protein product [Closterium sp. Naga37s-1]
MLQELLFDSTVAALLPSLVSSLLSSAFSCQLPSHHNPPLPSQPPTPTYSLAPPAFPNPTIVLKPLAIHVFSAVLRGRVRQRYSLPEGPLGGAGDCCTHCCCNACALMQEVQEMQVHGDIPAVKVTPAPHSGTDREGGNGATARKHGKCLHLQCLHLSAAMLYPPQAPSHRYLIPEPCTIPSVSYITAFTSPCSKPQDLHQPVSILTLSRFTSLPFLFPLSSSSLPLTLSRSPSSGFPPARALLVLGSEYLAHSVPLS